MMIEKWVIITKKHVYLCHQSGSLLNKKFSFLIINEKRKQLVLHSGTIAWFGNYIIWSRSWHDKIKNSKSVLFFFFVYVVWHQSLLCGVITIYMSTLFGNTWFKDTNNEHGFLAYKYNSFCLTKTHNLNSTLVLNCSSFTSSKLVFTL